MTNRDKRKLFYVVQFIELPFEGIDDYVCVPYSWLIKQKSSDRKVHVTYPKNEDPFDTRERVKRIERPNDEWRLYIAFIKYESEDYKDAEYWIATRNDHGPDGEKSEIRDAQPEHVLNRKLRSASQPPWSDSNSDKPQLTVKPYKNPRKPLPKMLIKRRLSQSHDKYLDNKRLKLNANGKSGSDTDHAIIASGCSKQERPIIIIDNQLVQNDQTKTGFASIGEINSEQSTQPGGIENNQSGHMSVQSSSKKLPAERQPSPKLSEEQQLSPKFSAEQQLSSIGPDYQQPRTMSVIHRDECNEDIESRQNVLLESVTEERLLTKTPSSTLEQVPQAEPINERSTPLVRHKLSHPEPHSRDVSVRQSKEPDDSQRTYLNRIVTAPEIVPRPPSTANQPILEYLHPQLPTLPASNILNPKPQPQEMNARNSMKVVHNLQKPRSQSFMQGTQSTFNLEPNWKKLSQLSTSSAKNQIPVVKNLKNPVDKKTRLEGIAKNITAMQYPPNSTMPLTLPAGLAVMQTKPLAQNHLQQAQVNSSLVNTVGGSMGEECVDQRELLSESIMNKSAAENLSKLAHQYSSFVEASREQQYLSTQKAYLQQFARMQNMLRTPNMAQTFDQRVHHQNALMNGGMTTIPSQPNPINQPIQFLPQSYNQYIPVNGACAQGVIRHELMRGSTDGAYTTYKPIVQNGVNVQLAAHNSLYQSLHNSNHLHQKRYLPNSEDPRTANTRNSLPLESERNSHILGPHKVSKRPRSLSTSKTPGQALSDAQKNYLFQEIDLQSRVNQSCTEYNNINLADVHDNFTVEPGTTTQDSKVQTMLSSDQQHKTQPTLVENHYVYRQPPPKKTMVDQATETDSIIDLDNCVDEIATSLVSEITSKVVDSACQTDEWLREKEGSLYQEIASDSANETEPEIESEDGVMSEACQTTLTTVQNLKPDDQKIESRIDAEQDMLSIFGTLLTQMGVNLSSTCDMFDKLRNSILVCAQTYEKLLEKVDKFNSIETLQIPKSSPDSVPQVPLMTQERPEVDEDNNTGVGDALTPIREQRGTFSLPEEYDPNDSKWTLKHREYKPGLVELLPRTGVYVSKKELKRIIQASTDCRTLARLLLTEVFTMNALSVCSLTGGRAKAFNSVNIDVRPGLDEHARMVLLAFIEEHGNKHGWVTSDTPAVISSIRTKINERRAKHGQIYGV